MVKSSSSSSSSLEEQQRPEFSSSSSSSSSSCKFKGVRKRKWGKYVCEIRLPNSRSRIWLGSYDTAEKAARAFDAALFCLRGRNAKFNFPDSPPDIPHGTSLSPDEIRTAAAQYANSADPKPGRVVDDSLSVSDTLSYGSTCPSSATTQQECESTGIPLDDDFLNHFFSTGFENNGGSSNLFDGGVLSGFQDFTGDFYVPEVDYWSTTFSQGIFSPDASAALWNFDA